MNLLVVLNALIDERSVSRAARRLHLTQPAVSNALSRLRQHFEDDLLIRSGQQMIPTPLAESLRSPVRDALLQIQSIAEARPDFDAAVAEHAFTIVASDYIAATFLPVAVRRLEPVAPGIRIEVAPVSERNMERFDRGEVDLLIFPEEFEGSPYLSSPLFVDRFTCIAWSENDGVHAPMSLEDYLSLTHVVAEFDDSRTLVPFDAVHLHQQGYERRIAAVTFSFTLLPHLVVGTSHIATVQARLATLAEASMPLKVVAPPIDFPAIPERMHWHRNRDRDLANMWLREFLTAVATTH